MGQIIHIDKGVLAVEQNKVLIPTMYNRYLAWGYADHSLRVGSYDSDKVRWKFFSHHFVKSHITYALHIPYIMYVMYPYGYLVTFEDVQ